MKAVALCLLLVASLIASSRMEERAAYFEVNDGHAQAQVGTSVRAWPSSRHTVWSLRQDATRPTLRTQGAFSGTATWYCGHGSACTRGYRPADLVAAIDPTTGIQRGSLVTVRGNGRSVLVRVVDVCACRGARIIDLTSGAFSRLAPLSQGVVRVTVSGAPALPNTDTLP